MALADLVEDYETHLVAVALGADIVAEALVAGTAEVLVVAGCHQ